MKKGDIYYYAHIIPTVGIYDLLEVKIRSVYDTYFVGLEKFSKQVFLFNYSDINKTLFEDRKIALKVVKEAEKNKKNIPTEIYYEED